MSSSYLTSTIPPDLFLSIGDILPPSSLNALTQTCTYLHSILQPTLDALLTPELANEILLKAAFLGKYNVVTRMLASPFSADPNTADSVGRTPLHAAASGGHDFIVEELLRVGADVGRSYIEDIQPLHDAVVGGNVETARLLLQHGAGIKEWYLTEALVEEDVDMVKLLLDNGANPNIADSRGWTPLHQAARVGDVCMVQELLDAGADVAWPCVKYHGVEPLHGAVVGQHVEAARLLLEHGAEVMEWGDGDLLHPLEEAVDTANAEMVKLLLEWGADAGDVGMAALKRAAQMEELPIMRLLLRAGANPDIDLDVDDIWPPAEEGEDRDDVMRLLVVHGATMEGPMATVVQNREKLAKAEGITEDQLFVKVKAYFASIGVRMSFAY
ncbi:ankyrin repeat-containing domain protein [Mycena amicta]|nr:ankyrin repeat-containing domain protein [Mycena amicta]